MVARPQDKRFVLLSLYRLNLCYVPNFDAIFLVFEGVIYLVNYFFVGQALPSTMEEYVACMLADRVGNTHANQKKNLGKSRSSRSALRKA